MTLKSAQITQLLVAWREGDKAALNQLMPLVYQELHRIARVRMRGERSNHSLQASALVNEAYMRLVDHDKIQWQNRSHFFAVAANAMRRILVDHARKRNCDKRPHPGDRVTLDEAIVFGREPNLDILALDRALTDLAAFAPRKKQIVELRFFAGLSVEETAQVLEISPVTVMREWRAAKAWLSEALGHPEKASSRPLSE